MELKTVLRELCLASGVNGCTEAADTAEQFLSAFTRDIHRDRLGNVWGVIRSNTPDAPTVLLEAHIDEIGFTVTHVDERGFLRVAPCGGVDNRTLSAAPVTVLSTPACNGVFCAVPLHLSKDDAPLPEITERAIDIGMDAEQAKARIPLGTRAVFAARFEELLNERVCSKALDNRAGVASILYALSLVTGQVLPVNVIVAFCVQEELGLRGAKTAAYGIRPDAAIVVDVSFAHTPDADKTACGTLGGGAMLGISPVLDATMTDSLRNLAEKQNIPFQFEVMGGTTGTDADTVSLTAEGIPSALLSVPLRYMHTPAEVVSLYDIRAVARLIAAFITEGEVPCHA